LEYSRRVLFSILLFMAAATAWSQPRLVLADGPSFDFGTMVAGERPVHRLRVTNAGNDTLRINAITVQCNCSTVRVLTPEIPPGEDGTLEIAFRSDFDDGPVGKNLSILSNDPAQPVTVVWFRAEIRSLLSVEPRMTYFSAAEARAMTAKPLLVTNADTVDVTVVGVRDSLFLVQALETGMLIPAGRTGSIPLQARSVGERSRYGTLQIETTSKAQPVVRAKYVIEREPRQK
jgi:hypothetical protein